jgi:hypothetical protein
MLADCDFWALVLRHWPGHGAAAPGRGGQPRQTLRAMVGCREIVHLVR